MNRVVKSLRKLQKGEGGVTLIEILVVVAILGVVAAIVILNVGGFIGTGTEEAANTEAHQVQTAIVAYMAAVNSSVSGGTIQSSLTCGNTSEQKWIVCYLMNPALLQASYDYDDSGKVVNATANVTGKWSGCTFSDGTWDCT